jgi:hypothetical protein
VDDASLLTIGPPPPLLRLNFQSLEYSNHDLCLFSAHCDVGYYVYHSLRQIPAKAFDMSIFVLLEMVLKSHKIITYALDTPDFIILYH